MAFSTAKEQFSARGPAWLFIMPITALSSIFLK
jgi:hypothetical protein